MLQETNIICQCSKGDHWLQPDLLLGCDCPAGEAGEGARQQAPAAVAHRAPHRWTECGGAEAEAHA
eukprot:8944414-Heterocapsa_arctica.AAC.1